MCRTHASRLPTPGQPRGVALNEGGEVQTYREKLKNLSMYILAACFLSTDQGEGASLQEKPNFIPEPFSTIRMVEDMIISVDMK